jgi:hypothetical protein
MREVWGCDKPTKIAQFEMTCPGCQGSGCSACSKTGRFKMHRCPQAVLRDEPELMDFVETLFIFERGALPAAGGWCDQSAWWTAAMRAASTYKKECDDWRMEKERKKAEAEAKRKAPAGGRGRR